MASSPFCLLPGERNKEEALRICLPCPPAAPRDPASAGVVSSVKEAPPPPVFDVFSFETDPGGSAGKDSVVGHVDLPPPEGSRWIQFANESEPVALPEHVIQRLLNENLSDEDDIHKVLCGLLQMYNRRQLSTEASQANKAAMEAMKKAKKLHKRQMDEKRKETDRQVGEYKVKREAELSELETHRDQMFQEVDKDIENEKKKKRLDGDAVLADWTDRISSLSENPEAMMRKCVTAAQNLKINDAFLKETQYRIAEGINVCGNNMQKHITKLGNLLDIIDSSESDTIDYDKDLGYWLAFAEAMQHLHTNMPYSNVEEDKMSDADKRKYKSDLASAEQNAATHLWDSIYKFYPCPGCYEGVKAALHRGGRDGKKDYYKEEMKCYDYGQPCVNSFLSCNAMATVAGRSPDKRFCANPNAEFYAFGAVNTHLRFPKLGPEVFQVTNEELIAQMPPALKKYLKKDGKIPKGLRKLNDGKTRPIGADPVTDAHLAVAVLEIHQRIKGSNRCIGWDTGAMIRAMIREHHKTPGVAITDLIFGFYDKVARERNTDDEVGGEVDGDEVGDEVGDDEVGGEVDGDEVGDEVGDDEVDGDEVDGDEVGKTADSDVESMLALYGGEVEPLHPQKKKKKKKKGARKSKEESVLPIDNEPQLLDGLLRFLNDDDTALISVLQPASADSVLRQDQKDDMLTSSIASSEAFRERLKKASDDYWKLMAREDLDEAQKNEIVDCQVNKIFLQGFGRLNAQSGKMFWNEPVEGDEAGLLSNFEGPYSCIARVRCPRLPPAVIDSWLRREEISEPTLHKVFKHCMYPKEYRLENVPGGKKTTTDWKNIAAGKRACEKAVSTLVSRMEKYFVAQNKKNKREANYEPVSILDEQAVGDLVNRVKLPHNWTIYQETGRPDTEPYDDYLAEANLNFPEKFRPENCTDLKLMQLYRQGEKIKQLREDILYATNLAGPKGRPRGSGKSKKGNGGPSEKPKPVQTEAEKNGIRKCMVLPNKTKAQQSDISTTLRWKPEFYAKLRERRSNPATTYTEADMVAAFKCFGPGFKDVTAEDIREGFHTPDGGCIIRGGGIPWTKAQKVYKVANVPGGNPYRAKELTVGNHLKLPSGNNYIAAVHYAIGHIKVEMARAQGAQGELDKRAQLRKQQSDAIAARSEQVQRATVAAQQEQLAAAKKGREDVQKAADEAKKVADAKLDAAQKAETKAQKAASDAKQVADAELAAARKKANDEIAAARQKVEDEIATAMKAHNDELDALKAELAAEKKARVDEKSAAAKKAEEDEKSAAANKARVDAVVAARAKRAREEDESARASAKKAKEDEQSARAKAKRPREDEEPAAGAKKAIKPSDEAIRWAEKENLAREAQIESINNMVDMGLTTKAEAKKMMPAKVTPADYYVAPVADGARP